MSKSDENRSAFNNILPGEEDNESNGGEGVDEPTDDATEADEAAPQQAVTAGDNASGDDGTGERDRFSVYADRSVFERAKVWAQFLDVPQADILERAVARYCDELADEYNDGDDPKMPKADTDDPLL